MNVLQRTLRTRAGIPAGLSQPCSQGEDTEEPRQEKTRQKTQRAGGQKNEPEGPLELDPEQVENDRVGIQRANHQSQHDGEDRDQDEGQPVQEPVSSWGSRPARGVLYPV